MKRRVVEDSTDPTLFQGMKWGTGRVLQATRDRLSDLGWRWRELETLWDLDRPEDLKRYLAMADA